MTDNVSASARARERLAARAAEKKKALEAERHQIETSQQRLEEQKKTVTQQLTALSAVAEFVDDELALALLLSLMDAPAERPLPEMPDTKGLPLRDRKAIEEAETAAVLGDVQQSQVQFTPNTDGTISIGTRRYRRVECGASHGGHSNLCGYMSLTMGKGAEAVALKQKIAPLATRLAAKIGAHTDFAGAAALADTEVVRAYVLAEKTPVCVCNERAGVATTYRSDACANDCVYLYLKPGHFQRLVPV